VSEPAVKQDHDVERIQTALGNVLEAIDGAAVLRDRLQTYRPGHERATDVEILEITHAIAQTEIAIAQARVCALDAIGKAKSIEQRHALFAMHPGGIPGGIGGGGGGCG
jgi:hypothetical protein